MKTFHIDVENCSACGETHKKITFNSYEGPPVGDRDLVASHHGICPTTGVRLYIHAISSEAGNAVAYTDVAAQRPTVERPTLGVMPRRIWLEQRQDHLLEAAQRFHSDGKYSHAALVSIFEELHCNAQELAI